MAKAKKQVKKREAFDEEEKEEPRQSQSRSLFSKGAEGFDKILRGFVAVAKRFPVLTILLLVIIGSVIGFEAGQEVNISSQGFVAGLPSVEYWYTSNATKLTDVVKQEIKTYTGASIPEYLASSIIQQPFFIYKDKQGVVSLSGDVNGVIASYYMDTKNEKVLTYLADKCTNTKDVTDVVGGNACGVILASCAGGDSNACKYNKTASDVITKLKAEADKKLYASVTKADKPKVEVFVMSHCPYGKVGMAVLAPVATIFGNKIDAEIKFVNYLMHGAIERDDNTKIYCIQKEQKDKLWTYTDCVSKGTSAEECMKTAGVDATSVATCMNATDTQFNITGTWNAGGTYPKYNLNAAECEKYGVQGSPTLVINGQVINGDWRSPEKLKTFICAAFNNPPEEECGKTLEDTAAAPSGGCGA